LDINIVELLKKV